MNGKRFWGEFVSVYYKERGRTSFNDREGWQRSRKSKGRWKKSGKRWKDQVKRQEGADIKTWGKTEAGQRKREIKRRYKVSTEDEERAHSDMEVHSDSTQCSVFILTAVFTYFCSSCLIFANNQSTAYTGIPCPVAVQLAGLPEVSDASD